METDFFFFFLICWKDAHIGGLSVRCCRVAAAFAILSFGKLGGKRLWSAPHSRKVASLIPARTFLPGVCVWLPAVCVGFLSHSDSSKLATWEPCDWLSVPVPPASALRQQAWAPAPLGSSVSHQRRIESPARLLLVLCSLISGSPLGKGNFYVNPNCLNVAWPAFVCAIRFLMRVYNALL